MKIRWAEREARGVERRTVSKVLVGNLKETTIYKIYM
jgi:hypothetical protein